MTQVVKPAPFLLLGRGFERRYFYNAASRFFRAGIRVERIVLWGRCNYACPYCKREVNFVDDNGLPISTRRAAADEVLTFVAGINPATEMLRVSGGDPVAMPLRHLRWLLSEARERGIVTSVATNMSSRRHVEEVYIPLVDYVAGDFKAPPRYWEAVTSRPLSYLERTVVNWSLLGQAGKEAEVRIPVFPFTTIRDVYWIVERVTANYPENLTVVLRNYSPVSWLDWEPTPVERVLAFAEDVAARFSVNVIARLRWKTRTIWFTPDGEVYSVSPRGELRPFAARPVGVDNRRDA